MKDKVINTHPRRFGFEPLFLQNLGRQEKNMSVSGVKNQ